MICKLLRKSGKWVVSYSRPNDVHNDVVMKQLDTLLVALGRLSTNVKLPSWSRGKSINEILNPAIICNKIF
jgi:hypothetical protein